MQHLESMGDKWFPLGIGESDISGVISTTLELGGTRPAWTVKDSDSERMLMAWPAEGLLRSSVIVAGKPDGQLSAVAVAPLMEGLINPLKVVATHAWNGGHAGEIAAHPDGMPPLWFYDPLFFRDHGVAEGSIAEFRLSGLCYGIRRALLDELTITQGPAYEKHALDWMKQNPDKTRLDVPALKIPLKGKTIIDVCERTCEYQSRAVIHDVDSFMFGPEGAQMKVYRFSISFSATDKPLTSIEIYAPERVCYRGYEPKEGDEVDMIFWLQGRISDAPEQAE
ncbi:MAG: hypothetical protein MJ061_05775 [Mailhella sp.]|nr:hypothetical protein [Mailhella sp.]